MWRSKNLNEVKVMLFEQIYERFRTNELPCEDAASLLGVSLSTFYRLRQRYESMGAQGLVDQRVGKLSARAAPVDEVMRVLSLFETKYYDFTVKHFHEKLPSYGIDRSYTWTKNLLQNKGLVPRAPRRGAHRRRRARRPMPGMMLHQDGSTHEWVSGQIWDLIVTMDDADSRIYSGFFVEQEGTMSTLAALKEVIETHGLFCSLYADRASHYWNTPSADGPVDRENPTQVGRALGHLNIELIPAYSPEARGRSERMFGTLQKRLPQELRLQGIESMAAANRFLRETYLPDHNRRFTSEPQEPGSAFIPWAGQNLEDILCVQVARTVNNDNTVRYKNRILQIPADAHRCHYVKARVRVHEYVNGSLAVFHGPRKLAEYWPDGRMKKKAKAAA